MVIPLAGSEIPSERLPEFTSKSKYGTGSKVQDSSANTLTQKKASHLLLVFFP